MKKLILSLVFVLVLLFAGCISTEVKHVQNADGSAFVTQTMDLSGLMSYMKNAGSSGSAYSDSFSSNPCESMKETDITCTYREGVLTLSKNFQPGNTFYKFEVQDNFISKKYRLTIDELPSFVNSAEFGSSGSLGSANSMSGIAKTQKLTDPANVASAKMMKTYGFEMTYIVSMPGEIKSAEGATSLNASSATFDLIDMMSKKKQIIVESEELSIVSVIILLILGIVILLLILLFVYKMMKPPSTPTYAPPSAPTVQPRGVQSGSVQASPPKLFGNS